MATEDGRSPIERLRTHYDHEELTCAECGYDDEDGHWQSETDGKTVHYYHECPQCGAVREHTLSLSDD